MTIEQSLVAVLQTLCPRVFPDVAHPSWLDEVPETDRCPPLARLAAELATILLQKYEAIVKNFVRNHPHVRYAVPEQHWGRL